MEYSSEYYYMQSLRIILYRITMCKSIRQVLIDLNGLKLCIVCSPTILEWNWKSTIGGNWKFYNYAEVKQYSK